MCNLPRRFRTGRLQHYYTIRFNLGKVIPVNLFHFIAILFAGCGLQGGKIQAFGFFQQIIKLL